MTYPIMIHACTKVQLFSWIYKIIARLLQESARTFIISYSNREQIRVHWNGEDIHTTAPVGGWLTSILRCRVSRWQSRNDPIQLTSTWRLLHSIIEGETKSNDSDLQNYHIGRWAREGETTISFFCLIELAFLFICVHTHHQILGRLHRQGR